MSRDTMLLVTEDEVVVEKKYIESLKEDRRRLMALENAGVDNWDGYEYAMDTLDD